MDLKTARADVDEYVAELLDSYQPRRVDSDKIVRDAVYGFQRFYRHEIPIIDSPLIQRLRGIHQTALTNLVYPSANHTRFEHSLGVATKAEQMVLALRGSGIVAPSSDHSISNTELLEIRLAGLLHDTGHGLFSHLTESVLSEKYPELVNGIKTSPDFAEKTNLGEALSAMMVRTPTFKALLESVVGMHPDVDGLSEVSAERISDLILGKSKDQDRQYQADIISGPFDADKLDYIGRDCHFTGIRAEVDWERINHALATYEDGTGRVFLAVRQEAVSHLEQILFSKMMLYSAVYHHHKIRTLERMVANVFNAAHEPSADLQVEPAFSLKRVSDIWRLSEAGFFALGLREPVLSEDIQAIEQRRLLQRALVLSMATVKRRDVEQYRQFQKLSAAPEGPETLRLLGRVIHAELPDSVRESTREDHIQVDFPRSPRLSNDAEQCHVLVGPNEAKPLSAFFPSEDWAATYADGKLTAHVFTVGDLDRRKEVADTAASVFQKLYGFDLEETARRALK
jgi:HD superfamily phosphohydrolase